jgi:signal transduction histidine kinase/ActR/RegA family two-component response regulator
MRRSISTKILISVLSASFLFMSVWGTVSYQIDSRKSLAGLRRSTALTATRLGHSLANPIWNLDNEEIARIIDYEVKNDNILAIVARSNNGRLISGRRKVGGRAGYLAADDSSLEQKLLAGSYFKAGEVIAKGGELLGTVTVYADDRSLRDSLHDRVLLSAFLIVLLCGGLSATLYLMLRRAVVKPLSDLSASVSRISINTLSEPIPIFSSDEIGQLAESFRGMTYELQTSLTQQRQTNEQLLQAQKMEAIGMLVGGISHDFNNILCAIICSSEMLGYVLGKDDLAEDDKVRKHLDIIGHAGSRAAGLIRQLLTLASRQQLSLHTVDLKQAVRHVVTLLQSSLDKSIRLQVELPDAPALAIAEMAQLEQVLLNLCINACHAMTIMRPEGAFWGGELRIALKQTDRSGPPAAGAESCAAGTAWTLSVSDTGVGMDQDTQVKIFTPFYTTKKAGTGTGLGLTMAQSIVAQHQGSLTVISAPGSGSTFYLTLPTPEKSADDDTPPAPLKPEPVTLPEGCGTIMLVDDDKGVLESASEFLAQCGYTVLCANNGAEGIGLARVHGSEIRLTLLDMNMPVMSGRDALPEICAAVPSGKVVLVSGFKQDPRVQELLARGLVDDFIQKPYSLGQLALAVGSILGDRTCALGQKASTGHADAPPNQVP